MKGENSIQVCTQNSFIICWRLFGSFEISVNISTSLSIKKRMGKKKKRKGYEWHCIQIENPKRTYLFLRGEISNVSGCRSLCKDDEET